MPSPNARPRELGRHDEAIATGPPLESVRTDPHLSDSEWRAQLERRKALAAEAQRLWEEKARAEAEEWARRESAKDAGESAADGDEPSPRT